MHKALESKGVILKNSAQGETDSLGNLFLLLLTKNQFNSKDQ